jgi:hypothetical protein
MAARGVVSEADPGTHHPTTYLNLNKVKYNGKDKKSNSPQSRVKNKQDITRLTSVTHCHGTSLNELSISI